MPKLTITPVQALLILLNKDAKNLVLRKWLLSGIDKSEHADFFYQIRTSSELQEYSVTSFRDLISEDPVGRYFETQLSYHTIIQSIDNIPLELLEHHLAQLKAIQPKEAISNIRYFNQLERALTGNYDPQDDDLFKEYASYIRRIKEKIVFEGFSEQQQQKITLIVQSSIMSVVNALTTQVLPLDLYSRGMYDSDNRGKKVKSDMISGVWIAGIFHIAKEVDGQLEIQGNNVVGDQVTIKGITHTVQTINQQNTTQDYSLGLMKGHMALPRDSVAITHDATPMLKPVAQATYINGAAWVENNFDLLTHPFSNSISGTMLAQLRNLGRMTALKNNSPITQSHEAMNQFFRLYIATMQFGSGGHSLYEFSEPLRIKQIMEYFPDAFRQPINLESLFSNGNEAAFNLAIKESIIYNQTMIHRAMVNQPINSSRTNSSAQQVNDAHQRALINDFASLQMRLIQEIESTRVQLENPRQCLHSGGNKQKNILIQGALDRATLFVQEGKYEQAQGVVETLQDDIACRFGKKCLGIFEDFSYATIKTLSESMKKGITDYSTHVREESRLNQQMQRELLRAQRELSNGEIEEAYKIFQTLKATLPIQHQCHQLIQDFEREIITQLNPKASPS